MTSTLPEFLSSTPVRIGGALAVMMGGGYIKSKGAPYRSIAHAFSSSSDCMQFVTTNQVKLREINAKVTDLWMQVAQNPTKAFRYGAALQILGTGIMTLPSIGIVLSYTTVLGLNGTAVMTVIVLTPVFVEMAKVAAEAMHCTDGTMAKIKQVDHALSIVRTVSMIALFNSETFVVDGVSAGLLAVGKRCAFLYALASLIQYMNKKSLEFMKANTRPNPQGMLNEFKAEKEKVEKELKEAQSLLASQTKGTDEYLATEQRVKKLEALHALVLDGLRNQETQLSLYEFQVSTNQISTASAALIKPNQRKADDIVWLIDFLKMEMEFEGMFVEDPALQTRAEVKGKIDTIWNGIMLRLREMMNRDVKIGERRNLSDRLTSETETWVKEYDDKVQKKYIKFKDDWLAKFPVTQS